MPSTTSPMYPSPTLCTTTPISEVDLVRSRRAAADGRYCTRWATSATARLVAMLIAGSPLSARLTVAVETPSAAATSFIVTRPLTKAPRAPDVAVTPGTTRALASTRAPDTTRPPDDLVNRLQVNRLHH